MLWSYVSACKRSDVEVMQELRPKILELFDELEGPEENLHHIKEIRAKIVSDMDNNSFNDIEVASYKRDLVFYGYK
ncbi:hypothetical protein PQ459_10015 [Chryseobacterium sp. KACC 21268]|nr:hypothetical protein PQ459_10015 [Chryseobacterium sp. KACC 21268]